MLKHTQKNKNALNRNFERNTAKDDFIPICEIFSSIQGEGSFAGIPMLFIRVSGCTRACPWCDSKYHIKGVKMSIEQIKKRIKKEKPRKKRYIY